MNNKIKSCEKLMDKAFALLKECQPEKALKIGEKLRKLRYPGAFEIMALAYADLEKIGRAIKTLVEGLKKAPDVWRLWQLLGNNYSETKQFQKSFKAFEKGLACSSADEVSLNYNYALALLRDRQHQQALLKINSVIDLPGFPNASQELSLLIYKLKIELLNIFENYAEAKEIFDALPKSFGQFPKEWSMILSAYAYTLWKTRNTKEAEKILCKSIHLDKHNSDAQWLMREMNKSLDFSKANYYRIVLHGQWLQPFEGERKKPYFYTTYEVVADDLEEAISLIKKFEPKELHPTLTVEESRKLKSPKQPKGVYRTSGYAFYF